MNCPYCGWQDGKGIDSREVNDGLRRRRQCLGCGSRFTTYERLQPASLFVIKKDERREEFNRNKLLTGIRKACEKRPLPMGTVDKLADEIEAELCRLSKVEIGGPWFIKFTLAPACWYAVLDDIIAKGKSYGLSHAGQGHKVHVEFVSANPTGPLHIGHGRGAVTGDAVASVLQAAGYEVQREYYINDAGNQMRTLGLSLLLRYREWCGETVAFPDDCYQGGYITDLAAEIHAVEGARYLDLEEEAEIKALGLIGGGRILDGIRDDLAAFGVTLDNWFSEQGLFDRDEVAAGLRLIAEKGLTYEKDGVTWFRTTDFGDDKRNI